MENKTKKEKLMEEIRTYLGSKNDFLGSAIELNNIVNEVVREIEEERKEMTSEEYHEEEFAVGCL